MSSGSSTATHKDNRDQFIEILRGLSIIIVLYFHYSNRLPYEALGATAPATLITHEGKIGVYIFLGISGYLIAMSLQTCASLSEFYAKRISRIWPLFILASIIIFVFLSFFDPPTVPTGPKQFYENGRPAFYELIGQLFFLRDLGFSWVDGVFWSILVELKFYFWIGLCAAIFKSRYIDVFARTALVLGILDFVLVLFLGNQVPRPLIGLMHGVLIAHYLPFFAVGVLLFADRKDSVFVALVLLCFVQAGVAFSDDPDFNVLNSARWFVVLAGLLAIDHALLKNRVLLFFGTYSYSIYLFHQMIGLTVMSWVAPRWGMDAAIVVALICVLPLSVAASWAVEWRFRRRVGKMLASAFGLLRLNNVALPGMRAAVA